MQQFGLVLQVNGIVRACVIFFFFFFGEKGNRVNDIVLLSTSKL